MQTVAPVFFFYGGQAVGITDEVTFEQSSEVYSVAMEGNHCRGRGRYEVCAKALRWVCNDRGDQGERSRVKVEERRLKVQRAVRWWHFLLHCRDFGCYGQENGGS